MRVSSVGHHKAVFCTSSAIHELTSNELGKLGIWVLMVKTSNECNGEQVQWARTKGILMFSQGRRSQVCTVLGVLYNLGEEP